MFSETVDQYIGDNNSVRAIDAFIDSLNIEEPDFKYAKAKSTGRTPYDPAYMRKLYPGRWPGMPL